MSATPKKVLFVAYYFPPSGGPGVQRVLKHIKYLPEFGWQPIVLTVENGQFPARDESLLNEIPENTIVYRSSIFEPYDLYRKLTGRKPGEAIDVNTIKKDDQKLNFKERIAEFIRATFFIPDARIGWLPSARRSIRKIVQEHSIKAVYSSSPPYTCALIAKYAKEFGSFPWIAGFRDPWTGFISSPKRWAVPRAIDIKLERTVFETADAVECAWEGIIKDAMLKYPRLKKSKFHHIPNGYDSADFPDEIFPPNDKFTLTYTGSLYGRRNPESLFTALENLISQKKIDPKKICLRFVGRFGAEVNEMFEKASFKNAIEIITYVPHDESIKYLLRSDCLLLIVDESKESEEIVPGKVYEYIGVRRPIVAVAPTSGAIAALLRQTRSGKTAHQSEVNKIADIFFEYYEGWRTGQILFSPDSQAITKYERREAAKSLGSLLNKLTGY